MFKLIVCSAASAVAAVYAADYLLALYRRWSSPPPPPMRRIELRRMARPSQGCPEIAHGPCSPFRVTCEQASGTDDWVRPAGPARRRKAAPLPVEHSAPKVPEKVTSEPICPVTRVEKPLVSILHRHPRKKAGKSVVWNLAANETKIIERYIQTPRDLAFARTFPSREARAEFLANYVAPRVMYDLGRTDEDEDIIMFDA
ncbi:MAG: hypothetical protein M1825_002825 [Sarcosagium campestre]|nr:MAG: hypothetical protein M1825_002825 [Sarcosagium campestre]